jgi:outer membrane lipoprotein-sorting protein
MTDFMGNKRHVRSFTVPCILMVFIMVVLSGCASKNTSLPPQLEDLLAKAEHIDEISYDVTFELGGQTTTVKLWLKKPMIKAESSISNGITVVRLADMEKQKGYRYYPDTKLSVVDNEDIPVPGKADTEALGKFNPSIIGTGTIDGKTCTIVMYEDGEATVKLWLWDDYGLLIRSEVTVQDSEEIVVTTITNIDFSAIPDSVFTLPEDAVGDYWDN